MPKTPRDQWWSLISRARWFGGKGLDGELTEITALPWYTQPGALPAVRSEIATVTYPNGRSELYHLLVGYVAEPASAPIATAVDEHLGPVAVLDAPGDPSCMRALLTALVDPTHPAMEWLDATAIDPTAATSVWGGEQSNTTVCVGSDRLFKLFRKLESGRNLDVEVLIALNDSGTTPAVYGALVGDVPGVGRADLGMLVERVSGVTDGWEWACAAGAEDRDISVEARQLGVALRDVHRRLADEFGTETRDGAEVADGMRRRLEAAIVEVSELGDYAESLDLAMSGLAAGNLITQRVHGDFHLGQVLRSADGWTIIDFEGEPLKTLAERRQFDSVWKDVAGMLRSFDYVRGAHPEPESEQATRWSTAARDAFLEGYLDGADAKPDVLAGYLIDKAVYEVVYEVRNRPNWAHIPWRAVHDEARRVALRPPPN